MARSRNLKPGFFKNEVLAGMEPLTRLLYAGLWTLADHEGRLEDRPDRIKAEILPYDDVDVDSMLYDLYERLFIRRYEADGHRFIDIPKFLEHQNPHKREREKPSTIPVFSEESARPGKSGVVPGKGGSGSGITGSSPADSLFLIPDSLVPRTDSLVLKERVPAVLMALVDESKPFQNQVVQVWNIFAEKYGLSVVKIVSTKRKSAVTARMRDKDFDFLSILREIAQSDFLKGTNDRGWKADFDFVFLSANNFIKILEGKYRNNGSAHGSKHKYQPSKYERPRS